MTDATTPTSPGASPTARQPPAGQRVAVVTGAGSGIGRGAAIALAEAGFSVVLAGRRPAALHETAATAGVDRTLVVPTDVSDPAAVDALFAAVRARFGHLDVLFNNAGRNGTAVPLDETPVDEFADILAVNVTGMFLCARAAFALMRRQDPPGGRIINNGSISAHTPRPWAVSYTVSKHAVSGLTKQVALDGRPYGITCSQLDIGNVASPLTERMARGVRQPDGELRPEPTMDMASVARSVVLMATLPSDAVISELTVMAPQMPYVGRG